MLTAEQIRGARSMLRMEQRDLAEASGISVETIKRLERGTGPVSANTRTVSAIQRALETMGLEFIYGDKPGICIGLFDYTKEVLNILQIAGFQTEYSDEKNHFPKVLTQEQGGLSVTITEPIRDHGHANHVLAQAGLRARLTQPPSGRRKGDE